jgi:hypothetical protein
LISKLFFIFLSLVVLPMALRADEGDFSSQKWEEVNNIVDEIRNESAPKNFKVALKTGLVQIQTNAQDSIRLGQGNSVLAGGVLINYEFASSWSIEANYLYGMNAFAVAGSPNTSDASISWLDAGFRYLVSLDSLKLDNYIAFKALYHQNDSKMQLVSDGTVATPVFMTHYMGAALGVERSIPLSRRFGLLAYFNFIEILQATTPATIAVSQNGYGFEVSGELYYQFQLFRKTSRAGLSYWQQGNQNDFTTSGKATTGSNGYTQTAQALFTNLSLHY